MSNGTGTGKSITVGGIVATENFTLISTSGTISNADNGVVGINVSGGKTLDFSIQAFTSSTTAGYTKDGDGAVALIGGAYGGGFTLKAGTVVARGITAMGSGSSNTLTINGGTIAADSNRNFSRKYDGGITVGGNFQLGALSSAVSLSNSAANLTFDNTVTLGGAVRTVTIGANGVYTLGGAISNGGLTINALGGTTGSLILSGANAYTGGTTINGGTVLANTIPTAGVSSTGVGAVLVKGGTLGGGGTILGPVEVAGGAVLQGGAGVASGALTLNDNLTLRPNSVIQLMLGANSSHSSLTRGGGTWIFDPAQKFNFTGTLPTSGTVFYDDIIVGLAGDPGTEMSWTVNNAGYTGVFTYQNATIDLTLTVVPEPTTVLGGLLAVGALGWSQRRRWRGGEGSLTD